MAGKGDRPRPVNGERYRENYDVIFATKIKPHLNPDDENKQQAPPVNPPVAQDGELRASVRDLRRMADTIHRSRCGH